MLIGTMTASTGSSGKRNRPTARKHMTAITCPARGLLLIIGSAKWTTVAMINPAAAAASPTSAPRKPGDSP